MNPEKEAAIIREELAYIGRYQSNISPKLSKYQELEVKKGQLRKRLKEIGVAPNGPDKKMKKVHKMRGLDSKFNSYFK